MPPIKRLKDLTFQEILSITRNSSEYHAIIDLECAHAGVSLLPENPGPEPKTPKHEEDATFFKIGDYWFKNPEHAQAIIDLIIASEPHKKDNLSGKKVMLPMKKNDYYFPKIETTQAFTLEKYQTIAESAEASDVILSEWRTKKNHYDSICDERKDVLKEMEKAWDYAKEVISGIERIKTSLVRYLEIAQGSYPIAVNFLKEACKDNSIELEDETIYYRCTKGEKHYVISREEHQTTSVGQLLGATE